MNHSRTCVGLVGCGAWGRLILRELMQLGATVKVVDTGAHAREEALSLGAIEAHSTDVVADAFIVATPAASHAEVASALIGRRTPVLVEKPFTTDVASARRLAAAAPDHLFVGHIWRYHPGIELLGEIARSGVIGAIAGLKTSRTNWTSPRTDVDSVWNLVPHDLTIAIEILDGIPTPSSATAEVHDGRAVGLYAQLGSKPWQVIEASNRYRDKRREVRVHGTRGVAVLADPGVGEVEVTLGDAASGLGDITVERRRFSSDSALRRQLAAFLQHVEGGPPPKASATEGAAVVEAIAALRTLAGLA